MGTETIKIIGPKEEEPRCHEDNAFRSSIESIKICDVCGMWLNMKS